MADETQVQPISSVEVLELLLGAGLDRTQASALLENLLQGQRPEGCEGQRPAIQSQPGTHSNQSSLSRSEFERTVMETMQRLSQRLDSIAEKVDGSIDQDTVTESPAISCPAMTLWADRLLDSLPMPQWGQDEESPDIEGRKLVEVSESTRKAIKTAFEKPLPNAARLQTRKTYSFPMIEDTKCPKLDTVVKQNLSKKVKDSDVNVAKLQTLMLDAVAPLVHILEEA